jgi:L,D-transpeptidase YcbB
MSKSLTLGLWALALALAGAPAMAGDDKLAAVPAEPGAAAPVSSDAASMPAEIIAAPRNATPTPFALAIRQQLEASPETASPREIEQRDAITALYEARSGAPLWVTAEGWTDKANTIRAEFARAAEYGLNPADFDVKPAELSASTASLDETMAATEMAMTRAALTYADHARGGRIMKPAADLSSYLDRAPQLIAPKAILDGLASNDDAGAYLRSLHPQHPQFERLRQAYLAAINPGSKPGKRGHAVSADAKRLLANMEQWRWMPADMGDFYIWNNIPEFTQRVVDKGVIVDTEKIVAGLIDKQTPVFSRPMRKIVFRPKWKVPESIMVRELWPSLMRGGGLLAQYGLQIETKDGQPVNARAVNWAKEDIRNYAAIQPPGPKSVLGVVKFSFPNQHTVFMHDTQDKHLFAATQRTYSHGCMRVRNPLKLAGLVLAADKGWDAAKIADLVRNGPLDNEVAIERKVPVHMTYFTAMVGDDGKVKTFRDVYGHEKRITLALDGRWSEINKGRDHLAPVEPDANVVAAAVRPKPIPQRQASQKPFDFLSAVFGGGF